MADQASSTGLTRRELLTLVIGVPLIVIAIIAARPLVSDILNRILNLNGTMVFVVVAALVFAEAAIFFGFIFPGETAVILGGVVASDGRINVVELAALVVVAAIAGDSVGYAVGHRWGERVLELKLLEHRRGGIHRALALLASRGALAVFIARFTAFLRAVMPGLAGMSRLRYRTFLFANALGGIVWGISFTVLGYALGSAYHKAEKYAGWVSTALLIAIVLLVVGLYVRNKRRESSEERRFETSETDEEAAILHDLAETRQALDDDD